MAYQRYNILFSLQYKRMHLYSFMILINMYTYLVQQRYKRKIHGWLLVTSVCALILIRLMIFNSLHVSFHVDRTLVVNEGNLIQISSIPQI
jgi:hypothetical protein